MHTQVNSYDSCLSPSQNPKPEVQHQNLISSPQMLGSTEELKHSSIENKHATKASTSTHEHASEKWRHRALEWVDDPQFWICYKQHNFEKIL